MKNILLKNLAVFIVMSFLHVQFSIWLIRLMDLPGGNVGMLPILIMLNCLVVGVVSLITVTIFKGGYPSIIRIAVLFEILYLLILMFSGGNPVRYFFDRDDSNLLDLLLFIHSFLILFLMWFSGEILFKKLIKKKN